MTDRRCYAHANLPNAGPGNQSVGVGQNLYLLYAESLAPACDGVDPMATRCSALGVPSPLVLEIKRSFYEAFSGSAGKLAAVVSE
jgi:hypothetical protein